MADSDAPSETHFENDDRVSHQTKGLGTIKDDPAEEDLIVARKEDAKRGKDMVYVVWDDHRFPVGKVPVSELEKLNPATSAVSTGH